MTLDTSSLPNYFRSLNLQPPRAAERAARKRLLPGPPAVLVEVLLRLGWGRLIFDNQ